LKSQSRQLPEEREKCAHIAEILRAIAHPLRIRILASLVEEETHVNALAIRLMTQQAIVSQQLRILRARKLVAVTREGGFARYRISEPKLRDLLKCLEGCST